MRIVNGDLLVDVADRCALRTAEWSKMLDARRIRLLRLSILGCALAGQQEVGWSQQFPPLTSFASAEPSVLIVGAAQTARTGYSTAVGDINGDGNQDLVISSTGLNSPIGGKGEFEILWGPLEDNQVLNLNQPTSGLSRIIGQPTDEPLFASLWCADINGDGFDDIVIGEPRWNSFRGRGYIVFGSASFPDTVELGNTSYPFLTILGPAPDGWFGLSACAGDIDGDGYGDALLSAYAVDEVVVLRGGPSLPSFIDAASPSAHIIRIYDDLHPGQGLGERLAVKDVDADGFDDVLFGCNGNAVNTWNGMAILLFGGPNLPSSITLGNTNLRSVTITNSVGVDFLGSSVAIGDFDGDDEDDLVIGADGVDGPSGENSGATFILYSASELPPLVDVDNLSVPATVIMGSGARTWWGTTGVATDFDVDGFDDILTRCASVDHQPATRDTAAVIYGRSSTPDTIWVANDHLSSKFASELFDEALGRSAAAADLDGDGRADLILPAFEFDVNRGRVFVVFGDSVTPTDAPSPGLGTLRVVPNPFSDRTTLSFTIPTAELVRLAIYDVRGRRVAHLAHATFAAGDHAISWDGADDGGRQVVQGIYFARVETSSGHFTHKLTIVR